MKSVGSVTHQGERPLSITLRLSHPMPPVDRGWRPSSSCSRELPACAPPSEGKQGCLPLQGPVPLFGLLILLRDGISTMRTMRRVEPITAIAPGRLPGGSATPCLLDCSRRRRSRRGGGVIRGGVVCQIPFRQRVSNCVRGTHPRQPSGSFRISQPVLASRSYEPLLARARG